MNPPVIGADPELVTQILAGVDTVPADTIGILPPDVVIVDDTDDSSAA